MQDVITRPGSSRSNTDHVDPSLNGTFPFTGLEDLIHELRQPLSTIENLAFYLQLVSSDSTVCGHSERIQELVAEANRILEHAMSADSCCSSL